MKRLKKVFVLVIVLSMVMSTGLAPSGFAESNVEELLIDGTYEPGQLVVGMKDGVRISKAELTSQESLANLFPGVGVLSVTDLTDVSDILPEGFVDKPYIGRQVLLFVLNDDSKEYLLFAAQVLKENPLVKNVEPNLKLYDEFPPEYFIEGTYEPGQLIVGMKDGVRIPKDELKNHESLINLFPNIGIREAKDIRDVSDILPEGVVYQPYEGRQIIKLVLTNDSVEYMKEAMLILKRNPLVEYVELNGIYYIDGFATITVKHQDFSQRTTLKEYTEVVPAGPYGPYGKETFSGYGGGFPGPGSKPASGVANAGDKITIIWHYLSNDRENEKEIVPGDVIVGINDGIVITPAEFVALFPELQIESIRDIYEPFKDELQRTVFHIVLVDKTYENVFNAIEVLAYHPVVSYATPNVIVYIDKYVTITVIHRDINNPAIILKQYTEMVPEGSYGPYLNEEFPGYEVVSLAPESNSAMGEANVGRDVTIIWEYRSTKKPGDVDGNGDVNAADLSILMANFGKTGKDITYPAADIDGNGDVNAADLSILLANFGK